MRACGDKERGNRMREEEEEEEGQQREREREDARSKHRQCQEHDPVFLRQVKVRK